MKIGTACAIFLQINSEKYTDEGRPPSRGRGLKCKAGIAAARYSGRPPSRGRGLKSKLVPTIVDVVLSPPLAGAWIEIE